MLKTTLNLLQFIRLNFGCFLVSNDHRPNEKKYKFTSFMEKYNR